MNRLISIITTLILAVAAPLCAGAAPTDTDTIAPVLLKGKEASKCVAEVADSYSDWTTAEISGKITSLDFFIKPSVKLFMKRGSELLLSVRVPFKGEIARLELTRDSVLIVNKLNATYVKESLEQVSRMADITVSDIQDIFLGRAFIAGRGTLTSKDSKRVDIYSVPQGYLIVPAPRAIDTLVSYGFYTYTDGRVEQLLLTSLIDDTLAELEYNYGKNDTELNFTFMRKAKTFELGVELDKPKFGVKGFARIELPSGLRRLTPKEFVSKGLKFNK